MIFLRKNEGFKDVELPSKLEKIVFFCLRRTHVDKGLTPGETPGA